MDEKTEDAVVERLRAAKRAFVSEQLVSLAVMIKSGVVTSLRFKWDSTTMNEEVSIRMDGGEPEEDTDG